MVIRSSFMRVFCLIQCPRMTEVEKTIPDRYRDWVLDKGSLTERVQSVCEKGCFHIHVLSQHYGLPNEDEAIKLDLPRNEAALLREVYLMCGTRAWVYARSTIPVSTLQGRYHYLAHMGEQPLGAALFADPSIRRGTLEVVRLTRQEIMAGYINLTGIEVENLPLWGRRSIFYVDEKPLLVAEYFLPSIPNAPESAR